MNHEMDAGQRYAAGSRSPRVIGHRGAPGYRPEHSRASYELALELGVDAVEPDLVPTRDGVLVVRHENEIGGTTDVSAHPEFASRRTVKTVDGVELDGWFTEDFTWQELATLRCRERLPAIRPANTAYDDEYPILRFVDLLDLLEQHNAGAESGAQSVGLVAEIKHASYFGALGFDTPALTLQALAGRPWGEAGAPLTFESFEAVALDALAASGTSGRLVYLIDEEGAPADEVAERGSDAAPYRWYLTDDGLDSLVGRFHGISPAASLLVETSGARLGASTGVVERAHARGLEVFTWTLRAENAFLPAALRRGDDPAEFGDWRTAFRAVIGTGVDAVFADQPDLLRDLG